MYDLPESFDPSVFVGACLEMISFGVGSIHLNFNLQSGAGPGERKEAAVVSYSGIALDLGGESIPIEIGAYADIARLGELLNQDVVGAVLVGPQGFRLMFERGASLLLSGDESGFESYAIYLPGQREIDV